MKSAGIKKLKKSIVFVLVAALALPLGFMGFGGAMAQVEAETAAARYFYGQLTDKEKPFYDAMEQMYSSGLLKTGREDLNLTDGAKVYVTQEDLASYASGYPELLDWMGAARDAFYFDHPDIFYVDFSALSLRVTQDQEGRYHAYLGTGRRDNYFNEAFTNQEQVENAIAEYEKKLEQVVEEARNYKIDDSMDKTRALITWVHNYVTSHTNYKLESDFIDRPGDNGIYLIRTAYGSLVRGESACEGYSRAVKAILDRLNIPCVLVQGVYFHTTDQPELHMWNHVQLNGQWYGLDATMDDPIGGLETSEYLLVGSDIMSDRHFPNGVVSAADREFKYPELISVGEEYQEIENSNGLVVEYKTDKFEGLNSGYFRVSYQSMGYAEAAKHGKYILVRLYTYDKDREGEPESDPDMQWFYADPRGYQINDIQTAEALILPLPQCDYAEFAVTNVRPNLPDDLSEFDPEKHSYFYGGDSSQIIAQSKLIYNPEGNYIAPPYPETVTPDRTTRMIMEQSYNVSITFNDQLIQVDGETPGYKLTSTGPTAVQYSKVENFQWDGDRTISFRFTPSRMFADESIYYYFDFTGLVGKKSEKPPIEISYAVSTGTPSRGCPLCPDYYDWKLFGKPSLLEAGDLSMSDWETSDGSSVSDLLKNRLALVVTDPSSSQEASMEKLVSEENSGKKVLSSATYNISLTVCKAMVVQTGQSLKVSVGFPEGYGPESEGVTFKAYHFITDKTGKVTGVEEIDCVVTRFGLIITCDSFSPFAIVAVDGAEETTERTVILSHGFGGQIFDQNGNSINGTDSIVTLKENEITTVTIKAAEGYLIEQVDIEGVKRTITDDNTKSMKLELSYSDLTAGTNIVDVQFGAESVKNKEKNSGEKPILLSAASINNSPAPTPDTSTSTPTAPAPTTPASATHVPAATAPTTPAPDTHAPTTPVTPAPDTVAPVTPDTGTSGETQSGGNNSAPEAAPQQANSVSVPNAASNPATPAATRAPSAPGVTTVPASTSTPAAAAKTDSESSGSSTSPSQEPDIVIGGATAFGDTEDANNDADTGLVVLTVPDDTTGSSNLYWLIIPILILAAAVGAGLYYITNKNRSDRW